MSTQCIQWFYSIGERGYVDKENGKKKKRIAVEREKEKNEDLGVVTLVSTWDKR